MHLHHRTEQHARCFFYFYIAHWVILDIDNVLSVCNNVIVQSVGKNKKGGVSDGRFYAW